MATTLTNKRYANIDPILAKAYQIIDQSWIDAGFTPDDLERDDMMMDVYDGLIARGASEDEAQTYLKQTAWKDIERKHHEMFPHRG